MLGRATDLEIGFLGEDVEVIRTCVITANERSTVGIIISKDGTMLRSAWGRMT